MRKLFRRMNTLKNVCLLFVTVISFGLIMAGLAYGKEPEAYKIGIAASFNVPPYAGWWRCSAEIASDDINKAGGIKGRPIKLIFEDHKNEAISAVNTVNKLVDYDKAPVMTFTGSTPVMAALPVANRKGVVLVNVSASSPKIRNELRDWGFSIIPLATSEMVADARLIYNELGLRRAAIILERTEQGIPGADAFQEEFERLGGKVVKKVIYEQLAVDMRPQLLAIKAANPELVFCQSLVIDLGNILAQAKEVGLIPGTQFFSFSVPIAREMFDIARDAAEGLIWSYFKYDPKTGTPKMKDWSQRFLLRYGYEPETYAALLYDGINMITEAIKKYGYSPKGIRNYFLEFVGRDYEGVSGIINLDDHHVCKGEFRFMMRKGGVSVPFHK